MTCGRCWLTKVLLIAWMACIEAMLCLLVGRSLQGGHYVAFIRQSEDENDWLLFDDEKVTPKKLSDVKNLSGIGGADNHIAYLVCCANDNDIPWSSFISVSTRRGSRNWQAFEFSESKSVIILRNLRVVSCFELLLNRTNCKFYRYLPFFPFILLFLSN